MVAVETILALIGALVVARVTVSFLWFLKLGFFSGVNIKSRYAKAGSWAVVTGASDGIGRSMAIDLAKRGMNVCILARTKSKLDEVAEEITKRNVQARVIVFDFGTAGAEEYKGLFKELDSLQIGVLVNNVGVNYEFPKPFDTTPIEEDLRIVKINIESQLMMTKYVLPKMKTSRCGGIVNLSSISSLTSTPFLCTYAASKAFNRHFSNSLALELSRSNIDVLSVTPHFVISQMSKRKRATFDVVPPSVMARQTLNQLGSTVQTSGHRHHTIIETILVSLPTFLSNRMSFGSLYATMKKAQKKAAEAQK